MSKVEMNLGCILIVSMHLSLQIIHAHEQLTTSAQENYGQLSAVSTWLMGITSIRSTYSNTSRHRLSASGTIWVKKGSETLIRVKPDTDKYPDLTIRDGTLFVTDQKTGKLSAHKVSGSKLYQVLTGKLKLTDKNSSITTNTAQTITVLVGSASAKGESLKMTFSKYPNGNIKYLESWEVKNWTNKTTVVLKTDTMSINDPSKVPNSIFSLPKTEKQS